MEDPGTSAQNVAKMDGGSAHIEILHMATLDHLAHHLLTTHRQKLSIMTPSWIMITDHGRPPDAHMTTIVVIAVIVHDIQADPDPSPLPPLVTPQATNLHAIMYLGMSTRHPLQ
jgi:hypothetical protein